LFVGWVGGRTEIVCLYSVMEKKTANRMRKNEGEGQGRKRGVPRTGLLGGLEEKTFLSVNFGGGRRKRGRRPIKRK